MKKTATLLLFCILLSTAALSACSAKPPELSTIYDQLVERLEAAVDINTAIYGAGLPVYRRDGEEEALYHRYYSAPDEDGEYVMRTYSRYGSCQEIEDAVRAVYAESYADSILTSLLTGFTVTEGGMAVPARFREEENSFFQSGSYSPTVSGTRILDYGSMRILSAESTDSYLRVSIRSRVDAPDSEWREITLSFALQDGEWLLAAPSC